MPKKLSKELAERIKEQKNDSKLPLPVNDFVSVNWALNQESNQSTHRCYSTFKIPVTINKNHFTGEDLLLDFDERKDQGFVMTSDHLIYGASCGFRVYDSEGLVQAIVKTANEKQDFPLIYIDVWKHISDDAAEIESLVYGIWLFSGFATRIELQLDDHGNPIAKVWGGHKGIVTSKTHNDSNVAASVLKKQI
ncbi:MAG: hypothetical protein OXI37_03400 [Gammaproteobacteria bacterium]|nr:hypothetical protein [Gammaproteobacteria bacterium]